MVISLSLYQKLVKPLIPDSQPGIIYTGAGKFFIVRGMDCPVHCETFSSIFGTHPIDVSNRPPTVLAAKNVPS